MKKIQPSLRQLAFLIMLSAAFLVVQPTTGAPAVIWVAPGGSDTSPGSSNAPLATPTAALNRLTALAPSQSSLPGKELRIVLRNGVYPLSNSLYLHPAGQNAASAWISIEAAPGERPILSGGIPIENWKKVTGYPTGISSAARGHLWVADLPLSNRTFPEFRQIWINDRKAIRAREPNAENLARLLAWNPTNETATIPAALLHGAANPGGLEMVVDQVWEIAMLRVASIGIDGTNAQITFKQPESALEFHHPWPPVIVNAKYKAPFYLVNRLEFLDEPGEWFEDLSSGKLYYWPRPDEDLEHASVYAPTLETLVRIEGSSGQPMSHIQFKGITFAHTGWLRPSRQGHVPLQEGMYLLQARKLSPKGMPYHPKLDNVDWVGRPPAAVTVKNANRIEFLDCQFEHLGSAGLDWEGGTHDDLVQGCVFRDIAGNGIQLGKFSDTNVETHLPFNSSDPRDLCAHEKISNNVFTDCANEDWGCVGIGAGYAQDVVIEHNDVSQLPYTGISVGWGWTKMTNAARNNLVFANYVHHVGQRLGDLGGIYLLSAQPGTVVAENAIDHLTSSPYVPDPDHWFYLYLDEGSSGMTVRDNWCPAEKFLKNANGPGNIWTNNGPQVSAKIKSAAGLEAAFKNRLLPPK